MATKREYIASLTFQADASQAEAAVKKLSASLDKLLAKSIKATPGTTFANDVEVAIGKVAELKNVIASSTNAAGGLDLGKFSEFVNPKKLIEYQQALSNMGLTGNKAFMQLTQAIATAEIPLKRTTALTNSLWISLKNAAKWQLSASVLRGFTGAISTAYNYAKDLNESLTNIRIVTGQTADQMAEFAKRANDAAKALSTTTTDYTNASLIYYQQGLSDEEVQQRTNVTMKMANVSGQSAEQVSSQLTAIWNNFAKSGENLEYYADVITALGAATASSSSEISEGLEKFASIADTVGLSYKYATAALATVTAATRQSADVVGNSFKTLFARLQGLQLGETQDDGTDLNKYSEALAKVGINIKETNGDIKDMDTILDELGAKWNTLGKDQQIALAETVAGVRQYTQLISLMDNWGDFQENLDIVGSAGGALEEQQERYAEGWEASSKRVRAAAEEIYHALVSDDFQIGLNNILAGFLGQISNVITGLGGLGGVISNLGFAITQLFGNQISKSIDNFMYSIKMSTNLGMSEIQKLKEQAIQLLQMQAGDSPVSTSALIKNKEGDVVSNQVQLAYEKQVATQQLLQQKASQLSEIEKKTLNTLTAQNQERVLAVQKSAERAAEAEEELKVQDEIVKLAKQPLMNQAEALEKIRDTHQANADRAAPTDTRKFGEQFAADAAQTQLNSIQEKINNYNSMVQSGTSSVDKMTSLSSALNSALSGNLRTVDQFKEAFSGLIDPQSLSTLEKAGINLTELKKALPTGEFNKIQEAVRKVDAQYRISVQTGKAFAEGEGKIAEALKLVGFSEKDAAEMAKQLVAARQEHIRAEEELRKKINALNSGMGGFIKYLEGAAKGGYTFGQSMNALASSAMTALSIFNSIKGLGSIWNNDDISYGEKLFTTMMNIIMIGGQLTRVLNTQNLAMIVNTAEKRKSWMESAKAVLFGVQQTKVTVDEAAAEAAKAVVTGVAVGATKGETVAEKENSGAKVENTGITYAATMADFLAADAKTKLTIATQFLSKTMMGHIIIIGLIVGRVALLIKWYQKLKENTPEEKLKRTNEELEKFKNAASDAKTACSELQSTLDNFEDASEKLKGLDENTKEFQKSLIEANQYARDLIDAFNLVQGKDWHFDTSGKIVIDADVEGKISSAEIEAEALDNNLFALKRADDINQGRNLSDALSPFLGYGTGNWTENQVLNSKFNQGLTIKDINNIIEALQTNAKNSNTYASKELKGLIGDNFIAQALFERYQVASEAGFGDSFLNDFRATLEENLFTERDASEYNVAKGMLANSIGIATGSEYAGLIGKVIADNYDSYVDTSAKDLSVYDLADTLKEAAPNLYESVKRNEDGTFSVKLAGKDEVKTWTHTDVRDAINQANTDKNLLAYGDEVAEGLDNYLQGLTDSQRKIFDKVKNYGIDSLTEEELEAYQKIVDGLSNKEDDLLYGVEDQLTQELENRSNDVFDIALAKSKAGIGEFKTQWSEVWGELKDLTAGEEIGPEIYDKLSDGMKEYFAITEDGQYRLITTAEKVKNAFLEENQVKLTSAVDEANSAIIATGKSFNYNEAMAQKILTQGPKEENDFIKNSNGKAILDEWIQSILGDEAPDDFKEAQLAAAQKWVELTDQLDTAELDLANTAQNLNELDSMVISDESRSAAFDQVMVNEATHYGIDVEEVYEYAAALQETNSALAEEPELAKRVALANKEINNAITDLTSNFEEYNEILSNDSLKGTEQYTKALNAVTKDVEQMTGASKEAFSDDFFSSEELLKALDNVSNGVDGAIEEVQDLAAQDIALNLAPGIDETEIKTNADAAYAAAQQLFAENGDIEIGGEVHMDPGSAFDTFSSLLDQGRITVDGLNALFDDFGFDPEIYWEPVKGSAAKHMTQKAYLQTSSGDYVEVEDQINLDDNTTVYIPHLLSAHKKTNRSAAAPAPKTSGGGGGGSSKKPEKKNRSDEVERYHVVKNQLEDLQAVYDETSEAADRLFGQARVDKIEESIKATDDLIKKQQEYLDQIKANLPVDREVLNAYYKDLFGGEIEYDDLGNISNYEEIMDRALETYNKNTEALGDEDWEIFEKKYEQFKKYLEQYEETYDLLRDEEKTLQDLINQRIDAELEKIQYEIELKINTADDGLLLLDYQLENLEDKAFAAAEAVELFGEKAELIYDKIAADREGLERALGETFSSAEIQQIYEGNFDVLNGRELTENQASAIREYKEDLLELNQELIEVRDQMGEKLMQVFEDFNEKLQEGIDKFDHFNNVMENFRNIVDIVGQDYLGISNDMLKNLDQAMVDNAINKVASTRQVYETLMEAQARAQAAYEDALTRNSQEDILYWEQVLHDIGQEVESAQENWMQAWEDALDSAREIFEANVERAIDDFEKALLPFGDMEQFNDAYEKQKELSDQYLDDYQKIYELSKLSRDINNSIDDTDNIAGKQKLKALLDKINKAQEDGVQLSQYDLEYLQKEYDLRMAEIAMEEAQNAKNTVRMRRDNEGNWSYVYTNDSDQAADAAQKYEDALYAMQQTSSDYIDEMSDQLIATSKEMEEALAAVRVEDYASIEDYYKRLDEIQSYYLERMKYMQEEMQKALDNNKQLYEEDWQAYHDATGYMISDNDEFAMSYEDTILGELLGSESDIVDFTDRLKEALGDEMGGLIGNLLFAYEEWASNTDRAMGAAGSSTETFSQDLENAVSGPGGITEQSDAASEAVTDMANKMVTGFDSITSAVEVWQKHYSEAMEKVIKDNLAMIETFNALLSILSGTMPENLDMDQLRGYLANPGSGTPPPDYWFDDVSSFASGGYTGAWGNSGKMAILHQKELVLNAEDTDNLLKTIGLVTEISKAIDIGALLAGQGLRGRITPITPEKPGRLEQNVEISVNMPNVVDHNEIELAMRNLINTASQYANRK